MPTLDIQAQDNRGASEPAHPAARPALRPSPAPAGPSPTFLVLSPRCTPTRRISALCATDEAGIQCTHQPVLRITLPQQPTAAHRAVLTVCVDVRLAAARSPSLRAALPLVSDPL